MRVFFCLHVRHHINVVLEPDEHEPLVGILGLIMLGDVVQEAPRMYGLYNLLEANTAVTLELLVFVVAPAKAGLLGRAVCRRVFF